MSRRLQRLMGEAKRRRARGYRPAERAQAVPQMTLGTIPMHQVPREADAPLFTPLGVVAVHEAAHSVVAERVGFPVVFTRLTPEGRPIHSLVESGLSAGQTDYVLKVGSGTIRLGTPAGRAAMAGRSRPRWPGPRARHSSCAGMSQTRTSSGSIPGTRPRR